MPVPDGWSHQSVTSTSPSGSSVTDGSPNGKSVQASWPRLAAALCVACSASQAGPMRSTPKSSSVGPGDGEPDARVGLLALVVAEQHAAVGQRREGRRLAGDARWSASASRCRRRRG